MEAEARAILEAALTAPEEAATDLATFARALFGPLGGMDLELPERELAPEPPDFADNQDVAPKTPENPPITRSRPRRP